MIKNSVRVLALGLTLFVVSGGQARATLLAPGTTVVPDAAPLGPVTLLATTGAQAFSFLTGTGSDSGTFTASVYRDLTTGGIDITYQVTNSATSLTSLQSVSGADFAPLGASSSVTTDVSATGPGVAPTNAFRGGLNGGKVVRFSFTGSTAAEIAPGQSSQLLIVRTNGTSFTTGTAGIADGGATTVLGYSPLLSVPEPGSVVLMGMGVTALAGLAFRRRMLNAKLA